jgi:hypothetical protein
VSRSLPPASAVLPPAASVLRRALLLWGLGHLAIGDRRGWLLVMAHPLAAVGLLAFAALLIDGTRWMLVFPALLLFLAIWLGQALSVHRQAVALGARPGGELQIALFLPVVLTLVSTFWLVGGSAGSPATTLRRYVSAWENGRTEVAVELFTGPAAAADLASQWLLQEGYLRQRVAEAAARFGPTSGIDPDQPFNSLRFSELPATSSDSALVDVEIVRRQRVETVLLGFIPTATQMTVVVEELGTIRLRALPDDPPSWLSGVRSGARVWLIEAVDLATAPTASTGSTTFVRVVGTLVDNAIVKD